MLTNTNRAASPGVASTSWVDGLIPQPHARVRPTPGETARPAGVSHGLAAALQAWRESGLLVPEALEVSQLCAVRHAALVILACLPRDLTVAQAIVAIEEAPFDRPRRAEGSR